ncbi:MAG: pitrilysin family protein [Pseudomonadota bacterium]
MLIKHPETIVSKLKYTLVFLLILVVPALAISGANNGQAKIGSLTLKRWTTANGMQVLFAPSSQIPMVDLRLVFDAGSARDSGAIEQNKNLPGLAKLTNGLIYEGSKNLTAQQIAQTFEGLGVQYGNGSYRDMAVLDFRSLSDQAIFSKALDTINEILNQPLFLQKVLDRERNKLLVALKLAQESPSAKASLAFYKALYGPAHPYASPTNGTKESLKDISREHLMQYYKKYYVAGNAILAVVGDLSVKQVEKLAERISKTLGSGQHAAKLPVVKVDKKGQLIKIKHPSTQTTIVMGMPVLKRGDKDYYALYMGNHILGGSGFSSRLVKEIRVKQGLTYSVGSYFSQMLAKGPFQVSLTTKNATADQAVKLVNQVMADFIKNGPTADELEQAKLNVSGSFPLRTKSNKNIVEHLAVIGFYGLAENYLDTFKQQTEKVTLDEIKETFKRRVDLTKLSTIIVGDN